MNTTNINLIAVGNTIRSVAKAEAERYFKSENNGTERSALVYMAINAAVGVALLDSGLSFEQITYDIDATEYIIEAMQVAGYELDGE